MQDKISASVSKLQPGDPYCGNCGYSLKGLDDSARCPECGKAVVDVLMRKEFGGRAGKRYRSKATLFGLPVIDVAMGPFGAEKRGRARGIIAIGDFAVGWVAIGGIARGVVAVGGLAFGVFALGGLGVGLLTAFGGLAVALGIANGGLALGGAACGGLAVGVVAQGGVAVGMLARGGVHYGNSGEVAFERFRWLVGGYPPGMVDSCRPVFFVFAPMVVWAGITGVLVLVGKNRDE